MHVPVNEISRLIFLNQAMEAVKSLVAHVFPVVDVSGRCMCDHDVDPLMTSERIPQLSYFFLHLSFRILIRATIVPTAPLEPHDLELLVYHDLVVQIHTSAWVVSIGPDVMIPLDIIQRHVEPGDQEREILGRQIAAGQDQIDPDPLGGIESIV